MKGTTRKAQMNYVVEHAPQRPSLKGLWDEEAWKRASVLTLDHFVARSSDHHPKVEVKVTYRDDGVFLFFRVFDKYVRSTRTQYQSSVCKDSCAEFFVEPKAGRGYFNFEINCGGTMLLYFIEDATIIPKKGFAKFKQVPRAVGDLVKIHHSMPRRVSPEIKKATEWRLEYFVPLKLFEKFVGPLGNLKGQVWRANFYKCGDATSHPHWASWAPLHGNASFHLPQYFAPIKFK